MWDRLGGWKEDEGGGHITVGEVEEKFGNELLEQGSCDGCCRGSFGRIESHLRIFPTLYICH